MFENVRGQSYSTYVFNYVPLALSANGDWLYVMSTYATEPIYRPAYRISIATGRAQPIDALPVTGVARIISPAIEPVSGRLLLAGPYTTANNPGSVAAWSAGAQAPDFRVDLGVVFAAMWADDGRIITAAYTRVPGPFTFRVMSLSATGEIDDTYITAEADNAALVGVLNGFAAAYVTWNGSGERDLIVIRLADGAISRVQAAEPEGLMFAVGLRP